VGISLLASSNVFKKKKLKKKKKMKKKPKFNSKNPRENQRKPPRMKNGLLPEELI